jgi:hypothetical protein
MVTSKELRNKDYRKICVALVTVRRKKKIRPAYVGGADKSLAFPIFLFAAQPKEFFLDGLKKLEQRSHKCVELSGEYVNIFLSIP